MLALALLKLQNAPYIPISEEDKYVLIKQITEIRNRIRNNNHFFYNEAIRNTIEGFMLDINNLVMKKQENPNISFFSRKGELANLFLETLYKNYTKEHNIDFYARQTCVSSQHLSLVVKDQTGKTVKEWINDLLISEAIHLLITTNNTVQQIANKLYFADQSSFGKFFKKQKQISPLEYRKSSHLNASLG